MLNYKIIGNPSLPKLLLLHGFMESMAIWDFMLEDLQEAYQIILVDFPGHGTSEALQIEVYEMEILAQEIKKLVSELHLTEIHLHGHSMGGYVALAYAQLFPEDLASLGLFFSTYLEDSPEKKKLRQRSFRVVEEMFPAYVKAGIPNLFDQNKLYQLESQMEIAQEIAIKTNIPSAIACLKGMINRPDRKKVLERLRVAVLVINGEHDLAVDSYKTIDGLKDLEHVKHHLLDCGHCGHWELPVLCSQIMINFLNSQKSFD